MLKSIVQTSLRTPSLRHGFANVLQKSSWKMKGRVQCAWTASFLHRSGRQEGQECRFPLVTETASKVHPQSAPPCADDALSLSLSRLCLSPEEAAVTVGYRLPPASLPGLQGAILDPATTVAIPVDLPPVIGRDFIDVPGSHRGSDDVFIGDPTRESGGMQASNILQKRHRKMKRHQYKKWRKRNRFKLRMQKQRRRKKRRLRWERHLSRFRFTELSAAEGEAHLQKKRERLHTFLRYLGVPVDDIVRDKDVEVRDVKVGKKKRKGQTRMMSPDGSGKIVPQPVLPKGVVLK